MSIAIGYRITKPVETQEQLDAYMAAAAWCNANGARILDGDGYFEVVAAEPAEAEEQDALSELEQENAELKARLARIEEKLALLLDGDLK